MKQILIAAFSVAGLLIAAPPYIPAVYRAGILAREGPPSFFSHTDAKLTIPFDYIHGEIVLHLNVNGRDEQNFLLDSGSTASFLSQDCVKSTHLTTIRNSRLDLRSRDAVYSGSTIAMHVRISGDQSMMVTGNVSKLILTGNLQTLDMSHFESILGVPLSGILGYDYIRQFPIAIDYTHRTVTIFPNKNFRYRGDGIQLKAKDNELPTVDANLTLQDGSIVEAKLMIDTGSDRNLELNEPFGAQHDLTEHDSSPHGTVSMSSTGTLYHEIGGDIQLLTIGRIAIKNPETDLTVGIRKGALISGEWDGEIGNHLLDSYRALFDLPRGIIILEQQSGPAK